MSNSARGKRHRIPTRYGRLLMAILVAAGTVGISGCDSAPASSARRTDLVAAGTTPVRRADATGPTATRDQDAPQEEDERVRPRTRLRAGGVLDLTFDDLEFAIEVDEPFQREMLTPEIEALHEKSVILRGFILGSSVFQRSGIRQFVLIRDNQQCCFGPGAKIYHNVMVDMVDGASVEFSLQPVRVEGILRIQPWYNPEDGKCYSVFHLSGNRAR